MRFQYDAHSPFNLGNAMSIVSVVDFALVVLVKARDFVKRHAEARAANLQRAGSLLFAF
jgi:hypothetical protein